MNQNRGFLDRLLLTRRWVLHVLFWVVVVSFYVLFFGRKNSNYLQTLFFVGLLMPIVMAATYFLNYYLVPFYLMRQKYVRFAVYTIYLLMGALFLEMMVALLTFIVVAGLKIRSMSPTSFDLVLVLSSLLLVLFLALAIKMVEHWRQSREDYEKLLRDKMETELKFLKTQLNPHFLFNTLNNLYYLATQKSDKTPQAILALSEILDYVLHAGKSVLVPLPDELKQVNNYVALEVLRYEDRVTVNHQVSGEPAKYSVPPMTLVTLVENAFKHGVMPTTDRSWINIRVDAGSEKLSILIQNSMRESNAGNGIGLENLRRQLTYLCGDNFRLDVDRSRGSEFSVTFELHPVQ